MRYMEPWQIALLVLMLILIALLPWAFRQDRRREKAFQAWLASLPPALREAYERSSPRELAAQAVDVLEFFTTLGLGVVVALLIEERNPELDRDLVLILVIMPTVFVSALFPNWLLVRTGRTLGMMLFGLSARRLDGQPLTWDDALVLRRFDGSARAKTLVLREEDWERLRADGIWPLIPPKYGWPE